MSGVTEETVLLNNRTRMIAIPDPRRGYALLLSLLLPFVGSNPQLSSVERSCGLKNRQEIR